MENIKKGGRPANSTTYKLYKWKVIVTDKETNERKEGKFCSIKQLNELWNLNLSSANAYRLSSEKYHNYDTTMKLGDRSFLKRWEHIKIEKIKEFVNI